MAGKLNCDYLVVGTGAVGMAFVDTLLDESDATVVMVDNHHQPGGHWNDAYPFVRLHQPSHFYGVASKPLGSMRIDDTGPNEGYFELATGNEVQAYFEQVMREKFLPSGRVQYFPMCEFDDHANGTARFHNTLSNESFEVTVNQRLVDTTYFKTSVPSRHKRGYEVDEAVTCVAPNNLPLLSPEFEHYCIVGAGKTAMDVGVWLLNSGAAAEQISWVCPRRSWLMNREVTQGHSDFFTESVGGFANMLKCCARASDVDDLFEQLEASGFMLRIQTDKRPSMFHFATISKGEVDQLSTITHLIEAGRVASINAAGLMMQNGQTVPMPDNTLFIDCTASAVDFTHTDSEPVFQPDRITVQAMRVPNPCLSAAMIAWVECHYDTDEERNRVCPPVPLPDDPVSWMTSQLGNMMNQVVWSGEPELRDWITNCRLDAFGAVIRNLDADNPEHAEILNRLSSNAVPAAMNLQKLIEAAKATS